MNEIERFRLDGLDETVRMMQDEDFKAVSADWMRHANRHKYSYHFEWFGRPIIQYPQDIFALQEIIWRTKPDLIIETGVAHGGSLIFSASMLALLDHCGDSALGFPNRKVVGIDIDIRSHNRIEIEAHPLSKYIELIEGSSVSKEVVGRVNQLSLNRTNVMVILDSNHSHEHVLQELKLYSPLVTLGSYCVVFDTIVEYFSPEDLMGRPWGPGNSPLSAVTEFLKENRNFQIDSALSGKLALTVAPSGYLRRLY